MRATRRTCPGGACAREPVVAEVAYLRVAEQLLLPAIGNSHPTHLLATTRRTCGGSSDLHSTHAESTDADEPAIGQRDQRFEWSHGTEDRSSHRCGRARSAEAGRAPGCSHPGQPGGDCQEPGG